MLRALMAMVGNPKAFATFVSYSKLHQQCHRQHPSQRFLPPPSSSSVSFNCLLNGSTDPKIMPNSPKMESSTLNASESTHACLAIGKNMLTPMVHQDAEGFLSNISNMMFFDRLSLAWKILFPNTKLRTSSNARIAKQRLKMILFSERCAVSDEAKKKIVSNVIEALSEFVEIDSQDSVQLNVSADTGAGTLYSVMVPVRRVKPEYQYSEDDFAGKITSIEYKDTGETSGAVDVTFKFFVPNKN